MRNNFLEKSYTKCEGGANLGPFKKNQNWAYSRSTVWNVLKFVIECLSLSTKIY